jgi:hypothetical protein
MRWATDKEAADKEAEACTVDRFGISFTPDGYAIILLPMT